MLSARRRQGPAIERTPRSSAPAAALLAGVAVVVGLLVEPTRAARAETDDRSAAASATLPIAPSGAKPVSSDALGHAKEALERATRLRAAGDEAHAKAADGLAREWTEAARDLELAVAAEQMAAERRREAMRAQAQLQRTRTLVEEGIARVGRIQAELNAAASPPTKARTAVEVRDGGPKKPDPAGKANAPQTGAADGGRP
jgi:hypothetical protein